MRFFVVLTLTLLCAPALASAARDGEVRDALAVSIALVSGSGASVSWTPAPGAISYDLYRGATPDDLVLLTTTPLTYYDDEDAPLQGDVWYVVISRGLSGSIGETIQSMRGKCVATRGTTGYSVTLAHCVPGQSPF